MAIKNRYEYLSGILEALDVEHTEAEVHNNEVWRSKVLDGMGVEHTYDDINQTDLWREKVIEGINAMAGGGGLELTPMYITGTFTEMECNNSRGYANTFYIRDFIVDPENVLTSPPLWIINLVPQTITLTGANNDTTTLTIPQADLMGNVQYGAWLEWNDTTNNYDLKFKTEDFLRVETTSLSISLAPITLYDGTSETKAILRFEP